MRGYLENGQVGNPCVHVVCPFTIYRLGLSVPNKDSIQITSYYYLKIIPNNLILSILLRYIILTFCTVYFH